ncbi:MAG: hypothetical protein PF447_07080 [Spirochaetaceae bacterium]|jgi:hypothetical protein|nr:hypothetical protein [Spirochaetaceae bacterium]
MSDDYDVDTLSLDDLEEQEEHELDVVENWDNSYDDMDAESWDQLYGDEEEEIEKDPWDLN